MQSVLSPYIPSLYPSSVRYLETCVFCSNLPKFDIESRSHTRDGKLIPFLTTWLRTVCVHVVVYQNMCQHELHQVRCKESTRTSVTTVSPSKEIVTRHGQTLLLLLEVRSHVVTVSRRGIPERIVSFCFVVEVGITLDVVVGRGDSHSARNVKVTQVDTAWSCDLFKRKHSFG